MESTELTKVIDLMRKIQLMIVDGTNPVHGIIEFNEMIEVGKVCKVCKVCKKSSIQGAGEMHQVIILLYLRSSSLDRSI